MPKVSVIVPIYNVEPYIERCARSLFEQTLDDIEYIFVNDCTPDKSMDVLLEILEEYPNRMSQVRIINMPVNSGQAKVRKVGLDAASGDYIIYCDSDDWVDRTIYEKMWKKAHEEHLDMVVCGYSYCDGSEILWSSANEYRISRDIRRAIIADEISNFSWNKLIRKELFRFVKEWPQYDYLEDVAIITPIAYHCKAIASIDEPLYYYFNNPQGIVARSFSPEKAKQMIANTDLAISCLTVNGEKRHFRREILHRKCFVKFHCWDFPWKDYMPIYPETTLSCIFDPFLSTGRKFGILSKTFGIHGISKFFKHEAKG